MTSNGKKIKVTLIKSLIGTKRSHRATVRGLGLRRINSSVEAGRYSGGAGNDQ